MKEFGWTYDELMKTPAVIIGKIIEYKQAEAEGNERLENRRKAQEALAKLKG